VYVGLVTAVGGLLPTGRQASGQAALQTTMMGIAPIAGASLGGVAYTELSATLVFAVAGALGVLGGVVACAGASRDPHWARWPGDPDRSAAR
jgi:predicted MFS family arabinose efflux permease